MHSLLELRGVEAGRIEFPGRGTLLVHLSLNPDDVSVLHSADKVSVAADEQKSCGIVAWTGGLVRSRFFVSKAHEYLATGVAPAEKLPALNTHDDITAMLRVLPNSESSVLWPGIRPVEFMGIAARNLGSYPRLAGHGVIGRAIDPLLSEIRLSHILFELGYEFGGLVPLSRSSESGCKLFRRKKASFRKAAGIVHLCK